MPVGGLLGRKFIHLWETGDVCKGIAKPFLKTFRNATLPQEYCGTADSPLSQDTVGRQLLFLMNGINFNA